MRMRPLVFSPTGRNLPAQPVGPINFPADLTLFRSSLFFPPGNAVGVLVNGDRLIVK
jgi:hypothetical protein